MKKPLKSTKKVQTPHTFQSRVFAQKVAFTALFTTFATILGYIDALLPLGFLPIAGIKLGLANLAVLSALRLFGAKEAAAVSLLRVLLIHLLLFPSPNGLILSFCGALCSLIVMILLQRAGLHAIPISIFGSVAHNLAQTITAVVLLNTPALFGILLWLLPLGVLSGTLLGVLADLFVKKARKALCKAP